MRNNLNKYFEKDRFAAVNGIKLIDCQKGYAKAQMNITENHLNAANVVQGGAIFTLADLAFAAAVNSHGNVALAINASISFFQKSETGMLTAVAEEISKNNKLATYDVNIYNDNNEIIANFKGTAYITRQVNDELI